MGKVLISYHFLGVEKSKKREQKNAR